MFWCCIAGVTYAYIGYPMVLFALSRIFGRRPSPPVLRDPPTVALVIAAHNEAGVIEQRILNALALDYPRERLQIVIASDGSDDDTADICRRYAGRVIPLLFPVRRGKAATLNAAVEQLSADIVVFSDANTEMMPDSVRMLARWFGNEMVGAVCGRLILTDGQSGANADGLYWRYETFLKSCEGRLNGLLGANGALYAIRRSLFRPLPAGTIVDDFVIPLHAKLLGNFRLVYDREATAIEETAAHLRAEFGRRARIGVGGWQALGTLWPLLSPRYGWTAFTFWSHKILRWACPFLMIGAVLSSVVLSASPVYAAAALAQVTFYGLCGVASLAPASRPWNRPVRLCAMFVAMNAALLFGFVRWLRGGHTGVWQRTARAPHGHA